MNKNGYVTIETLLISSLIIGLGAYSTVKYINHSKGLANSSISRLNVNFENNGFNHTNSKHDLKKDTKNFKYSIIDDAYVERIVKSDIKELLKKSEEEIDRTYKNFCYGYKIKGEKYNDFALWEKPLYNEFSKLKKNEGNIVINNYVGSDNIVILPDIIDGKSVISVDRDKVFNSDKNKDKIFVQAKIIDNNYAEFELNELTKNTPNPEEFKKMLKEEKNGPYSTYKEIQEKHNGELIITNVFAKEKFIEIPATIDNYKIYKVNDLNLNLGVKVKINGTTYSNPNNYLIGK